MVKTLTLLTLTGLLSGLVLLGPSGCRSAENRDPAVAPKPETLLVSSKLIGTFSADQLRNRYTGAGAAFRLLVQHGISVYRIVYNTTNTDGSVIQASGALLVPATAGPLPLLSIQHGTILSDADAPSNYGAGSEAYTFGSVLASSGYVTVAPDYIGYGASKDLPHPYEHRASLASASLDMLRASREFLKQQNVVTDKRLFLAGYSEGGFATLSLQKLIQDEAASEFTVVASSCGAGAYDKSASVQAAVTNTTDRDAYVNRLYAWVLTTYDRVYKLNRPMTYYFREPFATQIATRGPVAANVAGGMDDLLTPSFRQAIIDRTDKPFLDAVRDNDVFDWKPSAPTRLYHGDADRTVAFLNSQNAYDAMRKRGATNVELITLRGRNHGTAIPEFLLGTLMFFAERNNAQ